MTRLVSNVPATEKLRLVKRSAFLPFIFVFVALALFWPVVYPAGKVFFGDELFAYWSFSSWWRTSFFTWAGGPSTSYQWILQGLVWPTLSAITGHDWASKLSLFFLAFLPGISAFAGTKILLRHWNLVPRQSEWLLALPSGLFYGLSFYNTGFTPLPAFSWPYILLPVLVALFIKGVESRSYRIAFLVALLSTLGSVNPLWAFSFVLFVGPFAAWMLLANAGRRPQLRQIGLWLSLVSSLVVLLNAFWIIPTYFGFALQASGIFQVYRPENLISFSGLASASRWSILDVFLVGHPAYTFFYAYPRNWTIVAVLLPLLSFGSLLTRWGRRPEIILLNLVALLSIFAAKGVQPPFGSAYFIVSSSLPYGAGAILRNVGWGAWGTMLSYSILAPLTLLAIYRRLARGDIGASRLARLRGFKLLSKKPALLPFLASIAILGSLIHGTVTDMQVYTYPHFAPAQIPSEYGDVNSELAQPGMGGKVLWVPDTGYYLWHGGDPLTAWPTTISSLPPSQAPRFLNLSPFIPFSDITASTTKLGEILSLTNTKYVVFHGDSIYPNRKVLEWLDGQVDLIPRIRLPYVMASPLISSKPAEMPGYQVSDVPLSVVSEPALMRGETASLILEYRIPPSVQNESGTGEFWAGFGIALEVLPAGIQPSVAELSATRIAESFIANQTAVSDASGFVGFEVHIPELALTREVDLYAWYYGGSFRQLSPLYFVGRFPISPPSYRSEFVLYENAEEVLPLFVPRRPLVMHGGFREMLLASQLDEFKLKDWGIVLDPSDGWLPPSTDEITLMTDGSAPVRDGVIGSDVLVLADPVYLLGSTARTGADENAPLPTVLPGYVIEGVPLRAIGSLILNRSEGNTVSLEYTIPQPILNESGTGEFWAGFGLAFEILPAGVQPSANQVDRLRIGESFWQDQRKMTNSTGVVNFTIPLPESFAGSEVDVYGRYYGGSFRALSPYYYLGRWVVRGAYQSASYGFEMGMGQTLRLVDTGVGMPVEVPSSGLYGLALKLKGEVAVQINSKRSDGIGNGSWTDFGPFRLDAGRMVLSFDSRDVAYIGTLLLFKIGVDLGSASAALRPNQAPAVILSYDRVSPTEWLVSINATRPFLLALTEPFDRLWTASFGQERVQSEPLYGIINGFRISSTGLLQVRIYYTLQTYLEIGLGITAISVAVGTAIVLLPGFRRRNSPKNHAQNPSAKSAPVDASPEKG